MQTRQRNTKYSQAIIELFKEHGHLSNARLLELLKNTYPELSPTTVHRTTCRLNERNVIIHAPPMPDGSMRYDANIEPHDHFICSNCGGIRDIDISESIIPLVSEALGGCKITGRLVINGSCEDCVKNFRKVSK